MSRLYLETSALLRALIEGDAALASAIEAYESIVVSALTIVEAERAVARAKRERRIDSSRQRAALGRVRDLERGNVLALDDEVLRRARRQWPVEPVRTLDAIHLASLEVCGEDLGEVDAASVDNRIRENARSLGFRLVP